MSYGSKRHRQTLGTFSSIFSSTTRTADIISRIVGNPAKTKLQYATSANGISFSTSSKVNQLVATAKFAAAREEKKYERTKDSTSRLLGIVGRQETFDTSYMLSVPDLGDLATQCSLSATGYMCISKVEQFSEFHN